MMYPSQFLDMVDFLIMSITFKESYLLWYITHFLTFSTVIYAIVYAFQVTHNPEVSDNTYSDTLEWTVETPGLIKCFANNSEGSSSEIVSLFITGKLYFSYKSE
jgi:hypothetical protein